MRIAKLFAALGCAALLAACGGGSTQPNPESTLRVIAGSELKDLEPFFDQIRDKTGVSLDMTYSGTIEGIDRIESGEKFDAAWFSQAKYLIMTDAGHHVKAQEKIMLSPVILGVKHGAAQRLGWSGGHSVTWKDVANASAAGRFRYAMTNPTASNSGFSAVVGVASALAGTSDALRASEVDVQKLNGFFSGQQLTAGSSGWLIDSFVRDQDRLDGIVNYEANLIALDKSGRLHERLDLIYPKEGIVTADYPLVLLDESKRPLYDKLVAYLKGDEFQRLLMERTYRRPVNPAIQLGPDFPKSLIVELPFPSSRAAVDAILLRYLNQNRTPAHDYFVLDVSGSMEGDRIAGLRQALHALAGDDPSIGGRFARFENREKMTMIPFSSRVYGATEFEMRSADDAQTLNAVKRFADELHAGGSTAIYSALETALQMAAQARPGEGKRLYSIVLMTDGENNRGDDFAAFKAKYEALAPEQRIKIFPILFGEGDKDQLQQIADLTGGRLFDGKADPLNVVFKQIRGYQ